MVALTTEQISIIVEASLIFLIAIFLLLIFIKYQKGKSKLKLLVFFIFFFILIAFALLFTSRLTYYPLKVEDPFEWVMRPFARQLLYLVGWYRFSFAFLIISTYFTYLLKEAIFDSKRNLGWHIFLILVGGGTIIFGLLSPTTESETDSIYHLVMFIVVFVYVFIVYIMFIVKSIRLFIHIEKTDKTYRSAIFSLILMAGFFILAVLMFVLDFLFKTSDYSIYYFLADVSILAGIVSAYFGYVKPRA
jgi:hypothetical protein